MSTPTSKAGAGETQEPAEAALALILLAAAPVLVLIWAVVHIVGWSRGVRRIWPADPELRRWFDFMRRGSSSLPEPALRAFLNAFSRPPPFVCVRFAEGTAWVKGLEAEGRLV